MGLENIRCFKCQNYGHLANACPEEVYAAELGDGKPPWCSQCDRETRLVYFLDHGTEKARRCYTCHPKSQTMPAQFSRCKQCRNAIYIWDIRSECGKHREVGQQLKCLIVVKGEVVKDEPAAIEPTGARK
jgi:Zinc knuckle